ncbi:hypothetical protein [Paenibacillus polymyxa]|uniref:hypothetical protein n=1 Tax=Paenibacillus polymyxa TaxID=1406 RepID=UPI0025B64EB0|nr:hypothetical protein [Paenibacillus polymyxa]MDN4085980.1 hypothetical protein [Paenibacillus polymyxa]MDN4111882.1 hypothetical protein [Paenibacillus polymyxa]
MASNTPNLSLYMKDPVADGNDFFDVETMMNDNWEKIDGFAGGMDEVKERLNTISRQDVTLQPGAQIINAAKSALFQLSGLTGRMLVNPLGRMGNCENVGLWSSNTTIALDTSNKTSGTRSFKLTLGSVPATASASFLTTPGRKYIAVGDVKNGNTSKVAVSINGIAGAVGNEVTSSSVFAPSVVRFAATDYFHIVTITGTGNSGSTFNMDSVRVYEISDADYAAAATLTPAQVAAKWPYVDSVMPVRNPYAIRYGENLLPPFYEWSVNTTGVVVVQGPYKATATRGVADVISPLRVVVPVLPNTAYTISSIGDGLQYIERRDDNDSDPTGEVATGVIAVGSKTFTTSSQTRFLSVRLRYAAAGSFTHENPMLNIGSTAKLFKPREDSMLALQTDLYADPVTGANPDTVFERDGQYFKSKKWQGLTLDGNRAWVQGEGGATAGVRQVKLVGAAIGAVAGSGIGVKFDGKLLPQGSTGNTADSNAVTAAGDIYFGIPVADSGWADGYGPDQNDIKAYFFGYKAYDANTITPAQAQAATTATWNGTGTKYWVQRVGAANFTQSVPQQSYAGYTPYQLVYQLATPTVEPIVSEGQLSFVEGDNQVEVGTGIVVREKAKLYQEANTKGWNINNGSPGEYQTSLLNYRVDRFVGIYRNSQRDSSWALYPNTVTPAGALAQSYNVDTAAAYTVSYLAFMPSPVVPFTGSYAANEKTLLSDLVDSVQQNTARVSVLENKKADKDNPAWLTPTLLNGWTNYGSNNTAIGYKKIGNLVVIKGILKGGVYTRNTELFKLPPGYRPIERNIYPAYAGDVFAAVWVNGTGIVAIDIAQSNASLAISIVFEAEQ